MQELTFIRPLRFLSPNAFAEGSTSDPYTANSCAPGWGTIDGSAAGVPNVTCVGIANISDTGPFSFVPREESVLTTEESMIDDIVSEREVLGRSPCHQNSQGNALRYCGRDQASSGGSDS